MSAAPAGRLPAIASVLLFPPPTKPNWPSVRNGTPPALSVPAFVKEPPPYFALVGSNPAIKLPDAMVQFGVNVEPPPVWPARDSMTLYPSGDGAGLTRNGHAPLTATPE